MRTSRKSKQRKIYSDEVNNGESDCDDNSDCSEESSHGESLVRDKDNDLSLVMKQWNSTSLEKTPTILYSTHY
ncbi:hypothetical protein BGZ76_000765 [Entomortierella beljakovae]|nr:hypothetical protein BGZ76_000765 [Entomortierella beljakovae]